MALQTKITIQKPIERILVEDVWRRRDYPLTLDTTIDVGTRRAPLKTEIANVKFLYARVEGDATVTLFKNLSPEKWTFGDTFLLLDAEGIKRLSFQADQPTKLRLLVAGE